MESNTLTAEAVITDRALSCLELEQAHLYLQQTQNGISGALKGLSEAQWAFKPSADQWSIAEIVEHVLYVQQHVLGPVREQLASAPAASEDHDCAHIDEIVINRFSNRLAKFPSPHKPAGDLSQTEALAGLAKNCGELAGYLETTPDLRQHALDAPPLKAVSMGTYHVLDGYQWILAAAAHTERHTKQILEVKAHIDFPAE
jgi:hypothetical protein